MRVTVDLTRCQGYANCVGIAPEVFDLDESGQVRLLQAEPTGPLQPRTLQAEALCPVQAIAVDPAA
jgi:ferredoxin